MAATTMTAAMTTAMTTNHHMDRWATRTYPVAEAEEDALGGGTGYDGAIGCCAEDVDMER